MTVGIPPEGVPFAPVGAVADGRATTFHCPLCGARFSHGTLVCGSCPLRVGCDVVKCPGCGYQFPRSSRIVEWWRRLTRRRKGAA